MYGIGSIIGGLISAFWLDTVLITRHLFLICCAIGLLVSVNGLLLDKAVEEESMHITKMGCWERAKKNGREIW